MLSSQNPRPNPVFTPPRASHRWRWVGIICLVAGFSIVLVLAVNLSPSRARGQHRAEGENASALPGGNPMPGALPGGSAAQQPPANPVPAPAPVPATSSASSEALKAGMKLLEQGKYVEGRAALSNLLLSATDLTNADAQGIREALSDINRELVFGKQVVAGDPLSEYYTVGDNDYMIKIAGKYKLPYAALEYINKIDARRIYAGQRLKVVRGPFVAAVSKSAFRLDLFLYTADGKPVFVRSFAVGLGEGDSTPVGHWSILNKVANPTWFNPRTGKYYAANDPTNPIGEYWLGLQGLDDRAKSKRSYGIHGTIEPDSIGKMASMGCIRLKTEDVELLYKLLIERWSTVAIEP